MNKLALTFCQETIQLVEDIEGAFINLGERLYKIRNDRMWESNWDSFPEFLAEIRLSEAKASKVISIYERYVLEYNIPQEKLSKVGWSSLYAMLPAIKDKESAEEWVAKGELMKRDDLEQEVREAKLGYQCNHENTKRVCFDICEDCGKRFLVSEDDY